MAEKFATLGQLGHLEVVTISQSEMWEKGYYGDDWGQIPGPEAGGFMNFDHYLAWRYQSEYRGTLKNIEYRKTLVGGRKPTGRWPGKTQGKGGDVSGRAEAAVKDAEEDASRVLRV